jgi:phosphatidate cytidylyltransferase
VSNLLTRFLTGLALGTVALAAIWFGGIPFFVFVGVVSGISAYEWAAISSFDGDRKVVFLSVAAVILSLLTATFGTFSSTVVALLGGAVVIYFASAPDNIRRRICAFGPIYVAVAGISLLWLRESGETGLINVALVMLCVWATDIGAYFAGRSIGGPKLAPAISPNKTWSGLVGGMTASGVVAGVFSVWFGSPFFWALISIGAALAVVAQAGDLLESSLKRHFGVKDSGIILPGHGGVLDRVDGMLTAAPTMAMLLAVFGSGVLWQ